MSTTLGLWLGPTLAVILTTGATRWLGWFQPRSRRRVAIRRIAERLAAMDSDGYPYKYDRFLEHYLGGRRWDQDWEQSDTQAPDGSYRDARGSAPKWWRNRSAPDDV